MTEDLKLSVSKTKTFIDCKKKFEFVYIQKLPRKDRDYHIFGKFCHQVLEDFHNSYIKNDSKEPFNIEMGIAFKKAMIKYKEQMTPEMKKECWGIINQYLQIITKDKQNNLSANVLACEKPFSFNVTENLILNGMIDRVQLDQDNVIHVCDYKTVKNKKYLKDDKFQLLTYAFVLLNEDPTIQKVRASYILLRHNFEYITTEFLVPEILSIKDKYIEYANQILTEQEYIPNPTFLCRYCEYTDFCPQGKKMLDPFTTYGEVGW